MKNRLRKNGGGATRLIVWLSIVVFVLAQSLNAYGQGCWVPQKSDAVAFPATNPSNMDLPHCHEIPPLQDLAEPLNGPSSMTCCDDHGGCIKGGCASVGFVAHQVSASFLFTPSRIPNVSSTQRPSSLPQSPFRPPILATIG